MKAVIFDMDGVLVDSEPLHFMVDSMVLAKLKIKAPAGYLDRFVGYTNPAMWRQIREDYNITGTIDELVELQMSTKLAYLQESDLQAIKGIPELLQAIKEAGLPTIIASSSPRSFIEGVIKKIGVEHYFDSWISGEEVENSKPEPDVFLKAAELIGVDPADCVVIEDSRSGTLAAGKAGMRCIGFQNVHSGNQDLSQADLIVDEIGEISLECMRELFV